MLDHSIRLFFIKFTHCVYALLLSVNKIVMDAPRPVRTIFRKSLCLRSTLDRCQYDPIAKVYFRDTEKTLASKQATDPPKAVEDVEDDLDDFKSPKKVESKVKRKIVNRRKILDREYTYPEGCFSTQDMIVSAWKKAKAEDTEYLSENEFEIFKDKKKRDALLLSKANFKNLGTFSTSAQLGENSNKQVKKSSSIEPMRLETTSVENQNHLPKNAESSIASAPLLNCLPTNYNVVSNSKSNSINSLRSELRTITVKNVIIPESDLSEDEVPASQLVNSKKLKNHGENPLNKSGELQSSKDLKASVNEICSTTEPTFIKQKIACYKMPIIVSIPLQILVLNQIKEIEKLNDKKEMVILPKDSKLQKKAIEFNTKSSPCLQYVKIHSTQKTSSSMNLPMQPSIEVESTKSEWRVEKMNVVFNKPSRENFKSYYCKKSRFSYIRSLRWKTRMLKRK